MVAERRKVGRHLAFAPVLLYTDAVSQVMFHVGRDGDKPGNFGKKEFRQWPTACQ